MTREVEYPNASHFHFPYYFSDVDGFNWRTHAYDLAIFFSSDVNDFIDCRCSRWDVDNYQIIIETWLKKGDLDTLLSNTIPGAVSELYTILGEPLYYDKTWTSNNTLLLSPIEKPTTMTRSSLYGMRDVKVVYPKNITSNPIKGSSGWFNVKIEAYISGNQNL